MTLAFFMKINFFHERKNPFREDIYCASDMTLLENIAEIKILKIMMNNGDCLIL